MSTTIINGDSLHELKTLPDNSVDSIVTDPPYELGFMGKKWDNSGIAYSMDLWAECLRILKPGGHLLAFGGTRTSHRMTVAIEDAGFEIRDSIAWIYGTGFPKSMDVSKQIDKAAGVERKVIGVSENGIAGGSKKHAGEEASYGYSGSFDITIAHPPEAQQWDGWGTALKPAIEPITVARKPISERTVAANVLTWGTGAINIDASRIGNETITTGYRSTDRSGNVGKFGLGDGEDTKHTGRWPANVILDEEAAQELDQQSGISKGSKPSPNVEYGVYGAGKDGNSIYRSGLSSSTPNRPPIGDSGGASRFFYVAKPGKKERPIGEDGTLHPTVKPLTLMRYLVRMVTPPGGIVLDPFAGSGTTLEAATLEGFDSIGIELTAEYIPLIESRIKRANPSEKTVVTDDVPAVELGEQATLF